MIDRIDGIGVAVSLMLLAIVLELARRRKLTEEYSVLWVLCGLALLVLSIRRDWLDDLTRIAQATRERDYARQTRPVVIAYSRLAAVASYRRSPERRDGRSSRALYALTKWGSPAPE